MQREILKTGATILTALLPSLCLAAPQPDLYPNKKLQSVSQVQVGKDIASCDTQANNYTSQNNTTTERPVVRKAARGAALGALGGSITGAGAGRGAGAGAAMGGTAALIDKRKTRRENETQGSPEYRKFMEACLEDQGYKVVGWKAG